MSAATGCERRRKRARMLARARVCGAPAVLCTHAAAEAVHAARLRDGRPRLLVELVEQRHTYAGRGGLRREAWFAVRVRCLGVVRAQSRVTWNTMPPSASAQQFSPRTRRDVELNNVRVADAVDVLDERAQAVAVRHDEQALAARHGGLEHLLPHGQHARAGRLGALGQRQLRGREVRVAAVAADEVRVRRVVGRRRHVVGAAPERDLFLAVLERRLGLVQARERAVVALVQAPVRRDGHVHLFELLQHGPARLDGARQHGCVGRVELQALALDGRAAAPRLEHALRRQLHVDPAREAVLQVPRRLAVAREDHRVHPSPEGAPQCCRRTRCECLRQHFFTRTMSRVAPDRQTHFLVTTF